MTDSDREDEWADARDNFADGDEDVRISDDDIRQSLVQAQELKARGNEFFRVSNWDHAFSAYKEGLSFIPWRKVEPSKDSATPADDELEGGIPPSGSQRRDPNTQAEQQRPLSDLDKECALVRSVLNGNIGACLVKLGDHKGAVSACSEALLDDPKYVKALQRRASSNEVLATWSSLTSAEKDYETLLEILPPSSPLLPSIRRSVSTLKPRIERAQKEETDEMMGKLKELGNSVLGRFGLSTDNFQFTPNGQGGYSMNFNR